MSEVGDRTLKEVSRYSETGLTSKELAYLTHWNHGQASGALSRLHKKGDLARLTETREGNGVYVLAAHVNGRETAAQGRAKPDECDTCESMAVLLASAEAELREVKAERDEWENKYQRIKNRARGRW